MCVCVGGGGGLLKTLKKIRPTLTGSLDMGCGRVGVLEDLRGWGFMVGRGVWGKGVEMEFEEGLKWKRRGFRPKGWGYE